MAHRFTVSVTQTGSTATSATYKCTVARVNNAYFGYLTSNQHLVLKGYNSYIKHWGFPATSGSDSWVWNYYGAWPTYELENNIKKNVGYGSLGSTMKSSTYWTETVPISRGTSRQGTKKITVGVIGGPYNGSDFSTLTKTITLKTTEIPKPAAPTITVSVDPITETNRYINISVTFKRYLTTYNGVQQNYYRATLYDKNNKVVVSKRTASFTHKIKVTQAMFNTTQTYTVKLIGLDGAVYATKKASVSVKPNSVGLSFKSKIVDEESGDIIEDKVYSITTAHLNNVTVKNIPEVWIKNENGDIVKTTK